MSSSHPDPRRTKKNGDVPTCHGNAADASDPQTLAGCAAGVKEIFFRRLLAAKTVSMSLTSEQNFSTALMKRSWSRLFQNSIIGTELLRRRMGMPFEPLEGHQDAPGGRDWLFVRLLGHREWLDHRT